MPSLKQNIVLLFCAHQCSDSIVRQFVNVRWHTSATVLLSQRSQRCYRHSCSRRCGAHHSRSPRQRSNPACFGQKTKPTKKSNTHLALSASCHSVEESSLRQRSRSVHSPSIVLGNFIQFSPPACLMIGSADLWTPGCRVDVDVARVERQSSCLHCIVHHSVQHTDPT